MQAVDALRVAAEGQALAPIERPPRVFAQLLDAANNVVGQFDGQPAPPSEHTWTRGEVRRGQWWVPVLPGTPPGSCRLIVRLYDPETGVRLLLEDGSDAHTLDNVAVERPVTPPDLAGLDLRIARQVMLGEIEVLGWRFNKLGFDHAPDTPLRSGEPLNVVLFWRARVPEPDPPLLALGLIGLDGAVAARWNWTPGGAGYPAASWQAAEVVRDPRVHTLPVGLAPGHYQLVLERETTRVALGQIAVVP